MDGDFDPTLRALGSEIRAEADFRGVPLGELATAAGITRGTLYMYLSNKRSMTLPVLFAIADRLSVRADVLLDRAEQRASRDAQGSSDSK